MADFHSFKVSLTHEGQGSRVEMDGQELKGVRAIEISGSYGDLTEVTITFIAESVNKEWA